MIIPSTPQNGILITIIGVMVSAPFFIKAYKLYKRQGEMQHLLKTIGGNEQVRGRLENISPLEADWIIAKSLEMTWRHGHEDFFQLLAEIADNAPLSELMTKPCSRCGIPRNRKSKQKG